MLLPGTMRMDAVAHGRGGDRYAGSPEDADAGHDRYDRPKDREPEEEGLR